VYAKVCLQSQQPTGKEVAMKIKEFMTHKVVSVHPEMSVKEFIRFLEDHRISGAPVMDIHGKVIGVASATDVIKHSHYVNNELAHCDECEESFEIDPSCGLVEVHKYYTQELFETEIGELMTKELVSLTPDNTVEDAIQLFLKTPVHRIIIMEGNQLKGVISTKDTLKALAAPNA
jgi:predicted transcriptional regulator